MMGSTTQLLKNCHALLTTADRLHIKVPWGYVRGIQVSSSYHGYCTSYHGYCTSYHGNTYMSVLVTMVTALVTMVTHTGQF